MTRNKSKGIYIRPQCLPSIPMVTNYMFSIKLMNIFHTEYYTTQKVRAYPYNTISTVNVSSPKSVEHAIVNKIKHSRLATGRRALFSPQIEQGLVPTDRPTERTNENVHNDRLPLPLLLLSPPSFPALRRTHKYETTKNVSLT